MSIDTRALFSTLEEIDEEIESWRREGRNDVARQIEQTKAEAMRTGEVREATPPLLFGHLQPDDIQNAPDVLLEVELLLYRRSPATLAELMDDQAERLRNYGEVGRLYDILVMRSAVHDLIRLGLAGECPERRDGWWAYSQRPRRFHSRVATDASPLDAGDINGAVRIANERWRHNNEARMAATETPDNFRAAERA